MINDKECKEIRGKYISDPNCYINGKKIESCKECQIAKKKP